MNKFTLAISFFAIILLHYTFFINYKPTEPKPLVLTKPPYQKVSVQLAVQAKPQPKPVEKKVIKKPIEKVVKKEIVKKPIKKEAKREILKEAKREILKEVKKEIKKPVEKIVKKEEPKKEIKEPIEKPVEKVVKKEEVKEVKQDTKAAAQSLEKYKEYKEDYLTKLRAAIDRNKKYPIASKRLNEQGIVVVSFTILKSGLFKDISIKDSSGKRRLDKAALKALSLTGSFEPFAKELTEEFMKLTVPIKFTLN